MTLFISENMRLEEKRSGYVSDDYNINLLELLKEYNEYDLFFELIKDKAPKTYEKYYKK